MNAKKDTPFLALAVCSLLTLTFMKFRLAAIPLSDILLLLCFAIFFLRTGYFKLTLYSYLLACFVILSLVLSLLSGGADSLMSSLKLLLPLFLVMAANGRFQQFNGADMLKMTKWLLYFGVLSQLLVVVLFYTGLAGWLFNVVEPGNLNRTIIEFKINVFLVPLIGLHRFSSLFIEPSWYAFFFGFFLILYFYQCRKAGLKITLLQDGAIVLAFVLTLSFTGLVFLLIAYLYRFIDGRYPLRLVIAVPLVIALLAWVLLTNDYLAHRIYLISTGNDGSFNARIFASFDKAVFILKHSDWLGAGPGQTLPLINEYFNENLTIQNAYLEAFAATGVFGGLLFIIVMHFSLLRHGNVFLQLPLALALCVSSVIFTPIFWLFSFYILHLARVLAEQKQSDESRHAGTEREPVCNE
tara:strand:- start:4649 stop:5881 length:1233 start_codon:yes stop_codon:yes gene_type:complete